MIGLRSLTSLCKSCGRLLQPVQTFSLPRDADAAPKHQRVFAHGGHGIQIRGHLVAQFFIFNQLGTQPQARERRAQVVRNRRQCPRALRHQTFDAGLHPVKGLGGTARLGRALFGQRW